MSWCLIESDPAVFWEILRTVGCTTLDFEELWSLDEDTIRATLQEKLRSDELKGLIFLYSYRQDAGGDLGGRVDNIGSEDITETPVEPIFMRQVIENSCGTQAALAVALNQSDDVALGEVLTTFRNFIVDLDPESRGWALANHPAIMMAHNAFAPSSFLSKVTSGPRRGERPFHFIAYVPVGGRTYLMDGLREAPVCLGPAPLGRPWYSLALASIQDIMRTLNAGDSSDIKFNAIGVVLAQNQKLEAELLAARKKLRDEIGSGRPDCEMVKRIVAEIEAVKEQLARWESEKKLQAAENEIRKMAMLPLYIEVLRQLGARKLLVDEPAARSGARGS